MFGLAWAGHSGALYGHKKYTQADSASLVVAGTYPDGRKIYLEKETAKALKSMIGAAAKDGVKLKIISGFRSVQYQKNLFERAVKRRGSKQNAAKFVAPPGHSEHHTGRAVDLGDINAPGTDLKESFEKTSAYKWLQKNAGKYGFKLSFLKDNPQGIAYEPWHWCYHAEKTKN